MLFARLHHLFTRQLSRLIPYIFPRAVRVFLLAALSLFSCAAFAGPFSIPGKLSVSPMGAAAYTVPLRVPPGTAGVVPHLELAYNSQAGNGLMGMGWSLGGLSSITRCPKTIAQDGAVRPVRFDANDRFCLDGMRLVAVTGVYGANNTEYRTEVESFTKVVSYGASGNGPAWFRAWTKDGRILTFGNTVDSRILAPDGATVRIWAENQSANSKGSYFTVSYQNASGQFYPTRIDYTGNSAQGLAPYNSVQFTYATRTDKVTLYQAGARISYGVRLSNIRTFAGTQLVDDYQVGYDTGPNTSRSRLVSLKQCASDGTCFPATAFSFNTGIGGNTAGSNQIQVDTGPNWGAGFWPAGSTPSPQPPGPQFIAGDFNADGKTDVYELRADGGYFCGKAAPSSALGGLGCTKIFSGDMRSAYDAYAGDINADGKTDLFLIGNSGVFFCAGPGIASANNCVQIPGASGWRSAFTVFTGDFNGDSKTDLYLVSDTTSYFCAGPGIASSNNCTPIATSNWKSSFTIVPGDFNGDGVTDFFLVGDTAEYFCAGPGLATSNNCTALPGANSWKTRYRTFTGDFNGDGVADLYLLGDTGSWLCAGPQIASTQDNCIQMSGSGNWKTSFDTVPGDFNGDGITDVLFAGANGNYYCPGPFQVYTGSAAPQCKYIALSKPWKGKYVPLTGNFFGEPVTDVLLMGLTTTTVGQAINNGVSGYYWAQSMQASYFSRGAYVPDLLIRVTDGEANQSNIIYAPLTDPNAYAKETNATYPLVDVAATFFVARQITSTDGRGGYRDHKYWYAGGKADLTGRGFLGFRRAADYDVLKQQTSIAYYVMGHPYTGLFAGMLRYASNGTLIYENDTYYNAQSLGGTRYKVTLNDRYEDFRELDGTFIKGTWTHIDYDGFNNPNLTKVQSYDSTYTLTGWGQSWTNTYNNDTTNWFIGQLSQSVQSAWNPSGSLTRTWGYTYDPASGLPTKQTDNVIEPDTTSLTLTTAYGYDGFGNRTSVTATGSDSIAPRGTWFVFDSRGQFVNTASVGDAAHYETYTWDPKFGGMKSRSDFNRLTTAWQYDMQGRTKLETRPDATTTSLDYQQCATGCPTNGVFKIIQTQTGSPTVTAYYDALDRVIRASAPGFSGTAVNIDTQYDVHGRVAGVTDPYFGGSVPNTTTYQYDELDRPLLQSVPGVGDTTYAYAGFQTVVTDPALRATTYVRNLEGQLASVRDANGKSAAYAYDPKGSLIQLADSAGNTIKYTRDARGLITRRQDPNLGTWNYRYNTLGELVQQTDAKSQIASFLYDKFGRLYQRTEPDATTYWDFDNLTGVCPSMAMGKLCRVRGANLYSRAYSYDVYGRMSGVKVQNDTGYNFSLAYDTSGRVATRTFPTGFVLKNNYNAQGYLASVSNNATGAMLWRADSADAVGRYLSQTLGNGVVTTQAFDPVKQVATDIRVASAAGTLQHFTYPQYDTSLNLQKRTDDYATQSETFSYDNLNRLLGIAGTSTGQTAINDIGNITQKNTTLNYTYNPSGTASVRPNAIASLSGGPVATYGYDANGNVTSDGVRTYTQMSFNLPQTITKGATTLTFLYGTEHQRIKKSGPGKVLYYLDQMNDMGMRIEKEVAGTLTTYKHYLSAGGNIFGLYSQPSTGAAQTRYFHRDNLGSITAITNETGGLVERLAYDAWGKRRQINGQPDSTNSVVGQNTALGYTGHEHLDEVGLIHMNGRIYDPTTARFLSPDPVIQNPLDMQNLNRYSYVLNNPTRYTDPTGFEPNLITYTDPTGFVHYYDRQGIEYITVTPRRDSVLGTPVDGQLGSAISSGPGNYGRIPGSADYYYAFSGAAPGVYFYSGSAWSTGASPVYGSSSTTSTVTVNANGSTTTSTTWTYTNSTIPPSNTQPGPTSSTGSSSGTTGNATHAPSMSTGGRPRQMERLSPGTGYYRYSRPSEQWGAPKTISFIERLGRLFDQLNPGQEFGVGDISKEGGGSFPPHSSHRQGTDIDIRPLRLDDAREPVTFRNSEYDDLATQDLVNQIKLLEPDAGILFNDRNISGVKGYRGHDNHLHIKLQP